MERTTAQEQQIGRFLKKLHEMNKEDAFSRDFRVKLTYSEPVRLGRSFSRKAKTEFLVRFFRSTNGRLCVAPNRKNVRSGYPINGTSFLGGATDPLVMDKLVGMENYVPKDASLSPEEFDKKEAKKVLNRLHENIWSEFRKELEDFIKGKGERPYFLRNNGKAVFRNIKSIFKHKTADLEGIKAAMDTKGSYSCRAYGTRRDRSVEVTTSETGTRAWFSSEYSGCGNGSYYLLINPTTALYVEDD